MVTPKKPGVRCTPGWLGTLADSPSTAVEEAKEEIKEILRVGDVVVVEVGVDFEEVYEEVKEILAVDRAAGVPVAGTGLLAHIRDAILVFVLISAQVDVALVVHAVAVAVDGFVARSPAEKIVRGQRVVTIAISCDPEVVHLGDRAGKPGDADTLRTGVVDRHPVMPGWNRVQ